MAQRIPLPLTVSYFSKIQIGFTFSVPPHPGIPGQRAVKQMCVCVCLAVIPLQANSVLNWPPQLLNQLMFYLDFLQVYVCSLRQIESREVYGLGLGSAGMVMGLD